MSLAPAYATKILLTCSCAVVLMIAGAGASIKPADATRVMQTYCTVPPATPRLSASAQNNPDAVNFANNLADAIESARTQGNIPGLSYALVYQQDVIVEGGAGCSNTESKTPATADTVYEIGSVTKLFTATLMMQLRDAGKFALGDEIDAKAPQVWWNFGSPASKMSATYQQLASYYSGLPDDSLNSPPATTDDLWQYLNQVHTLMPPGQEYVYSDIGYAALGHALASIAGPSEDYEPYTESSILEPLGMSNSGFVLTTKLQEHLATGYPGMEPYKSRGAYGPAGGLLSTAEDLTKLLALQFGTGPAGGSQVISCSSVQEMWNKVEPAGDAGVADTGWFTKDFRGQPMLWKNGILPGYTSLVTVLPNYQIGLVLLTNLSDEDLIGDAKLMNINETALALAEALLQPESKAPHC